MAVDPDLCVRLEEAVKLQAREEPDMYLVSREGDKIPAHRSVMSLFSPLMKSVLQTYPSHLTACIIIPESSSTSLASMVAIFYTGLVAAPGDNKSVSDIEEVCGMLDFKINFEAKANSDSIAVDMQETLSSDDINEDSLNNDELVTTNNPIVGDNIEMLKNDGAVQNKCALCEFSSEIPTNLMKHYSVDHFNANISQLMDFYFELNFSTGNYDPCKVCNKVLGENTTLEKNTHKEVITHIGVYHMKILDVLKTNKIEISNLFRSKNLSIGSVKSKTSLVKKSEFECDLCSVTPFSTRTEFQDHLSGVHFWAELVGEYGNKYSKACSLCKFKFQTLQQLAKHIGTIHDKVIGHYKHKLSTAKADIRNSVQVEKLSCCFNCPDKFANQDMLKKHYISYHFADELVAKFGSYGSQCSLCFAWLNTKEELAEHIGDFHGKVNEMIDNCDVGQKLDEETVSELLPLGVNKKMSEEMLVKKMIEKSKKLMRERNQQNQTDDKKTIKISMKK